MLDRWALRNSAWKKKLAGYAYENRHLRGAACLHALNESEARSIRSYGLDNPICVIPNGVDLAAEPERWPMGRKQKVCLYLGRLHPKKGISALLRAWAKLPSHEWKLVLAGWGRSAHEREFLDLASSLGLDDSVSFVGPKFGAEKIACFRAASAFILPSLSEGLPMAVLEAWSYGLPVAITPECNLPEGFAAGAALPMQANEGGVAAALTALFAMKEADMREMGARGRRLVQEHFTWQHVTAQLLAVYRWILNGAPQPDCVRLN
jgi:glycosyltransferase involved in cell wall biosynthesis